MTSNLKQEKFQQPLALIGKFTVGAAVGMTELGAFEGEKNGETVGLELTNTTSAVPV